jgi:hypothetical protein
VTSCLPIVQARQSEGGEYPTTNKDQRSNFTQPPNQSLGSKSLTEIKTKSTIPTLVTYILAIQLNIRSSSKVKSNFFAIFVGLCWKINKKKKPPKPTSKTHMKSTRETSKLTSKLRKNQTQIKPTRENPKTNL